MDKQNKIADLLKQGTMTQKDIGKEVGVSQQYVSKVRRKLFRYGILIDTTGEEPIRQKFAAELYINRAFRKGAEKREQLNQTFDKLANDLRISLQNIQTMNSSRLSGARKMDFLASIETSRVMGKVAELQMSILNAGQLMVFAVKLANKSIDKILNKIEVELRHSPKDKGTNEFKSEAGSYISLLEESFNKLRKVVRRFDKLNARYNSEND